MIKCHKFLVILFAALLAISCSESKGDKKSEEKSKSDFEDEYFGPDLLRDDPIIPLEMAVTGATFERLSGSFLIKSDLSAPSQTREDDLKTFFEANDIFSGYRRPVCILEIESLCANELYKPLKPSSDGSSTIQIDGHAGIQSCNDFGFFTYLSAVRRSKKSFQAMDLKLFSKLECQLKSDIKDTTKYPIALGFGVIVAYCEDGPGSLITNHLESETSNMRARELFMKGFQTTEGQECRFSKKGGVITFENDCVVVEMSRWWKELPTYFSYTLKDVSIDYTGADWKYVGTMDVVFNEWSGKIFFEKDKQPRYELKRGSEVVEGVVE